MMEFIDHDIVVEDSGLLFRACISGAALKALWCPAAGPIEAEALIADHRSRLEEAAIRKHRAGLVDCGDRVKITAADLGDWTKIRAARC